jgi:hypothetical protein
MASLKPVEYEPQLENPILLSVGQALSLCLQMGTMLVSLFQPNAILPGRMQDGRRLVRSEEWRIYTRGAEEKDGEERKKSSVRYPAKHGCPMSLLRPSPPMILELDHKHKRAGAMTSYLYELQ